MKLWKVQKFAGDVVYDLRSRGLLPVAVLLLVGMLAVPFLISRGGGETPPPAAPLDSEASVEAVTENQPAVLAYSPGLRDYKDRLNELQSKDPFIQQFSGGAVAEASTATGATGSTAPTDSTGASSTDIGVEDSPTGDPGSGGGTDVTVTEGKSGKTKVKTRYFYFESDVLVGEYGTTLQRRNRIDVFSFLPSELAPVLVYMGTTSDGKRAVFLVAKDVIELRGPGFCFPSEESCQLLALSPEDVEDIVYGPDGKTYRVKLLRIKKVVSSKPPR